MEDIRTILSVYIQYIPDHGEGINTRCPHVRLQGPHRLSVHSSAYLRCQIGHNIPKDFSDAEF